MEVKRLVPYLAYLRPAWPKLAAGIACGVAYGLSGGLGIPALVQKVFPQIFSPAGRDTTTGQLLFYCSLPAIVMGIRGITGFLNTYLLADCGARLTIKLQEVVFERIQRLPIGTLQRYSHGDVLTRSNVDVHNLRTALLEMVQDLVKQPTTLAGSVIYLVILCLQKTDVLFLLLLLGFIPLCIIPIRRVGKNLKRRTLSTQERIGQLVEHLAQNIRSAREVRAYSMEEAEMRKNSNLLEDFRQFFMKLTKYNIILSPIIEIISAVGVGFALYYAFRTEVQLQDFLSAVTALFLCYEPVKKLGALNNKLQQGLASLERIEQLLHEPVTIQDGPNARPVGRLRGEITFHDVEFSYGLAPVLKGVNVRLEPGMTYALVGSSGAGKSTFASLIPRFYEVTAGHIAIDEIDLRAMKLAGLRRNIAVVSQEPVLFNGTIESNILLGRPGATRDEVVDAAKRAHAHEFIEELEHGYATDSGQAGSRLSGGQRQRIALARAFLKDAPILILDEATSALDSVSEQHVQEALSQLFRGKTVIIIAHRFSSIKHADRALVFDEGKIVEEGHPAELQERNGIFARLYQGQLLDRRWTHTR